MKTAKGQGEFFDFNNVFDTSTPAIQNISLSKKEIQKWQEKVYLHQEKFLNKSNSFDKQKNMFDEFNHVLIEKFEPLKLTPLPLSFWRLPKSYHQGAAIYVVMDLFNDGKNNLLLYIGETIAADQRWRGEHDCKHYLDKYSSCLNEAGLSSQLSIRFWTDVPRETRARRKLEQELIQRWLPPFNKETRTRWQTPFT